MTSKPKSDQQDERGLESAIAADLKLPYKNNASLVAPAHIDVNTSRIKIDEQISEAVRLVRPDLDTRCLTTSKLAGGLSNHLYIAQFDGSEEKVLVRIHIEEEGDSSSNSSAESFVDREAENRILAWLSSCGLAPAFHGRFLNGRVEQFYDGHRPLSWDEMALSRYAVPMARALAGLHRAEVPPGTLVLSDEVRRTGEIWSRVKKWFGMARCANKTIEGIDLEGEMAKEWEWLKCELQSSDLDNDYAASRSTPLNSLSLDKTRKLAMAFFRQIIFTHMDYQSLNILIPSDLRSPNGDSEALQDPHHESGEEAAIRIIDFEYAGLNPRAADIANTFNEHCNMNNLSPDYVNQYPTASQQDVFLRAYISVADSDLFDDLNGVQGAWDIFLSVGRDEIGKHTLLSHIGWSVWSVAQAGLSTIEFDYITYAKLRMEGYYFFKERHWQ